MPLLPGGDADVQRAIYQAVADGSLRLAGSDGTERQVTGPGEIGVRQSSLRLAKPLPVGGGTEAGQASGTSSGTGSGVATAGTGAAETGTTEISTGTGTLGGAGTESVLEKQVSFALRTSLSGSSRDALYALLLELGDRVDDDSISYAEVMIKVRVHGDKAAPLADLARQTGVTPDVRDA